MWSVQYRVDASPEEVLERLRDATGADGTGAASLPLRAYLAHIDGRTFRIRRKPLPSRDMAQGPRMYGQITPLSSGSLVSVRLARNGPMVLVLTMWSFLPLILAGMLFFLAYDSANRDNVRGTWLGIGLGVAILAAGAGFVTCVLRVENRRGALMQRFFEDSVLREPDAPTRVSV